MSVRLGQRGDKIEGGGEEIEQRLDLSAKCCQRVSKLDMSE
jgi:hypothetical protein